MALLLCIDTSTTHASVALAKDAVVLGIKTNENRKDHGSFLQPAIKELMQETGFALTDLQGVAVTSGPGSYTGLRVGFASAKGLCYALNLPLISISTTFVIAKAALQQINNGSDFLLCPMIDARRMEVFTSLYNPDVQIINPVVAKILEADSWAKELMNGPIYFFGDGAAKWQAICNHTNAHFLIVHWNAANMIQQAEYLFQRGNFSSLPYSVPDYGKEFHSAIVK